MAAMNHGAKRREHKNEQKEKVKNMIQLVNSNHNNESQLIVGPKRILSKHRPLITEKLSVIE